MNATELRAALDANGYTDAEIRGNLIHVRDKDGVETFTDHKRTLRAAGIPVLWGGIEIPGWYWFTVKLAEAV